MDGPYTEDTRLQEEGVQPRSNHKLTVPTDAFVVKENLQEDFASRDEHVTVIEGKLSQSFQPHTQNRPKQGATFTSKVHHFLVFLACCLATFTSMGTAFGMGSVYLDIVESYQTTRPLAAMVQSLASGLGFGAGIITGPVIGHVGGAATMVAGSLLCCVGCIGSSLAPNIYVVIVCFGAVTGFGVSCCFLSASVIAGTSFQENSKVVLPVVSMSGGVGMTVFPYMLRWLVDEFTLKGMFLILAGVSLNSVLFGIVLKVFDASRDPAPGEDELEIHVEEVTVSERQIGKESRRRISMYDEETGIVTKSHSKISICKEEIHAAMESENTEKARCKKLTKAKSVMDDNEETSDLEHVSDVSSNIIMHSPGRGDISEEHFQEDRNETRRQAENGSASHTRQNGIVTERRSEQERKEVPYNEHGRNKDMMSKTLSRRGHINVSFENDVDDMETALHVDEWNRHQEPRGMIKESSAVSLSKKVQISSLADDTQSNNTETDDVTQRRPSTAGGRRRSSVYEALQVGLVHNTRWVLVTIATYSRFLSFNLPGIFLTDIGRERGLNVELGTHLLVILFCSNAVGRGLPGLILYIRHFSALGLLGFTTLFAGLSAYGFTLLDYYEVDNVFAGYAVVCALYGVFYGGCITCCTLSCLELVNLPQFAQALGYQFFIGGISSIVGGPIGGWLKDYTGRYNSAFYMILIQGCIGAAASFIGMCFGPKSKAKRESRTTPAALGKNAFGKGDREVYVGTVTETYDHGDAFGKVGLRADIEEGREMNKKSNVELEDVLTRL